MRTRRNLLNAVPSVLWSVLCLAPVYVFCARHLTISLICLFSVAGVVAMMLPRRMIARLALSRNATVYRKLKVPLAIPITQDAPWISRRSGESGRRVRRDKKTVARMVSTFWMRERFHLGLFVFCLLCSVVALRQVRVGWYAILTVVNAVYNLYPTWLQQFLRMRVLRIMLEDVSTENV